MSLNIKNERVHQLAREVALRTGRNQTSAIELALQMLLDSLDRDQDQTRRIDLIHDMQDAVSALDLDTDDLYDEAGLPR